MAFSLCQKATVDSVFETNTWNKEGNDYEFEKEDVGVKFDYNDAEEAEAYVDEG